MPQVQASGEDRSAEHKLDMQQGKEEDGNPASAPRSVDPYPSHKQTPEKMRKRENINHIPRALRVQIP